MAANSGCKVSEKLFAFKLLRACMQLQLIVEVLYSVQYVRLDGWGCVYEGNEKFE
jgi:hypothetical protein